MQKGGITFYSPRKKNMPEVWPSFILYCENTTFKCRIWLSKNRTRKPFNRNSRRESFLHHDTPWRIMKIKKDCRMRRNCKYNEENLFPLCKYTRQFILLCWAIREYFQLLEKEKGKKPPCPNGAIEWCAWLVPRRNGQLLNWTRLPEDPWRLASS